LNGGKLEAGRAVPLEVGDKMEVGVFNIAFEGEREEVDVENTRMVAKSLVRRLKSCAEREYLPPYLLVQNGPAAGTRFDLRLGAKLRIGRGRDCEIVVDDARTSRIHATVHNQAGAIWLADAGSVNGSYLDGKPVTDPVLMKNGSLVRVGGIRLVLVSSDRVQSGWTAVLEASRGQRFPPALGVVAALVLGALGLLIAVML
jgi:predicted component of type VI protein secretion system